MRKWVRTLLALALLAPTVAAAQQASSLSQMPYASTPFNGSELIYVVQNGISMKTNYFTFLTQFLGTLGTGVPAALQAPAGSGAGFALYAQLTSGIPLAPTSQLYGGSGVAGIAQDVSLGPHFALAGGVLNPDATGTGILATQGDIGVALPAASASQVYGGTTAAGAAAVVSLGGGLSLTGGVLDTVGGGTGLPSATTGQIYGGTGTAGAAAAFSPGTHVTVGSGAVGVDATGTGILATKGDIAAALPSATATQVYIGTAGAGVAQPAPLGAGLTLSGGTLNTVGGGTGLPSATTSQLYGGTGSAGAAAAVSTGTHLSVTGSTLSTDAAGAGVLATRGDFVTNIPSATTSQLYGGTGSAGTAQAVTVGTGLTLSGGTLVGSSLPSATTSQLYGGTGSAGVAQDVSLGSHLSISGGTLSPDATGTGVLATQGDIGVALPSATTSQLYGGTGAAGAAGAVTVGTGLSLSGGSLTTAGGGVAFGTVNNVRDFGALGNSNGTTGNGADDSAAFQAAFNAAETVIKNGSTAEIFVPCGTYRITTAIRATTPSNAAWYVVGNGVCSQIYLDNSLSNAIAFSFSYSSPCGGSAPCILIQGLNFFAPTVTGATIAVSVANATSAPTFIGNNFAGYDTAIYLLNSYGPRIQNNTFVNLRGSAVDCSHDTSCGNAYIAGNVMNSNGIANSKPLIVVGTGLGVDCGSEPNNLVIIGNDMEGNYQGPTFNGACSVDLRGNYIFQHAAGGATNYPFSFGAGFNSTVEVSGNFLQADAPGPQTFTLQNVKKIKIANNTFYNYTMAYGTNLSVEWGFNTLSGTSTGVPQGPTYGAGNATAQPAVNFNAPNSGTSTGGIISFQNAGTTNGAIGSRSSVTGGAYSTALQVFSTNAIDVNSPGSTSCSSGLATNAAGTLSCVVSSKRFKHDIATFGDKIALRDALAMRPVSWTYNEDAPIADAGEKAVGLIAEEVASVDPRLVGYDKDGKPFVLRPDRLIGVLVGSIHELDRRLKVLEARAH